jgi:hypothetical protein
LLVLVPACLPDAHKTRTVPCARLRHTAKGNGNAHLIRNQTPPRKPATLKIFLMTVRELSMSLSDENQRKPTL